VRQLLVIRVRVRQRTDQRLLPGQIGRRTYKPHGTPHELPERGKTVKIVSDSQGWPPRRRASRLEAQNLQGARAHVDDFAKLATLEMGKRIDEARGEVKFSGDILAYYAKNAEKPSWRRKSCTRSGEAHMESSPIGVLFCVEPWNFPYYQLARVAGPHLMAGNTLVVKHSGCAAMRHRLREVAARRWRAGGLYTNLLISHEQSDTSSTTRASRAWR
jgi:succinate-semialdehyde dehydrogenase/glutarate-semialdehyde dehydrogenase